MKNLKFKNELFSKDVVEFTVLLETNIKQDKERLEKDNFDLEFKFTLEGMIEMNEGYLTVEAINETIKKSIEESSIVFTDQSASCVDIASLVKYLFLKNQQSRLQKNIEMDSYFY